MLILHIPRYPILNIYIEKIDYLCPLYGDSLRITVVPTLTCVMGIVFSNNIDNIGKTHKIGKSPKL